MALLIDTNVLVGVERGRPLPPALAGRSLDEPVFLAAITVSELFHGVHRADTELRRDARRRFVEGILDAVNVLPFDLEVARVHAGIWATLRQNGRLIGAHDLLIAATAIAHDLSLVTENQREFERVEGIELLS